MGMTVYIKQACQNHTFVADTIYVLLTYRVFFIEPIRQVIVTLATGYDVHFRTTKMRLSGAG